MATKNPVGTGASVGDLRIYFANHPEYNSISPYDLINAWLAGKYAPLLSFLYERLNEASNAYAHILHKYGNYVFARIEYFPNERAFVPLTEVLDTEYFLLLAFVELVEPKLERC